MLKGGLNDLPQESRVPAGALAFDFDAALGGMTADQVEGEAADSRHVFCAVRHPVAGEVILELDIDGEDISVP
ncbi:conserved hypothetical protein [uncultured Gammaproteobacteria bacterium]